MKRYKVIIYLLIIASLFWLSSCDSQGVYKINVSISDHGEIIASKKEASKNENIIITVKADNGYKLTDNSLKYNDTLITDYSFMMPEEDVIIEASFEKINYQIIYDLDGAINNIDNPSSFTIDSQITFKEPIKEGYDFLGFFLDEEGNERINSINPGTFNDIKIYALFEKDHECTSGEWELEGEHECGEMGIFVKKCTRCGKELEIDAKLINHNYIVSEEKATCTLDGYRITTCDACDYETTITLYSTGHKESEYIVKGNVLKDQIGTRYIECLECHEVLKTARFANNGYLAHGKLSVKGADLVDQDNNKFQLFGLSTHGIQWFGHLVTYETFAEVQNEFGNNVIRLSLYTSENGYCTSTPERKEALYQIVVKGIEAATKLGMYVIVDWHMVGAEDVLDRNPLTYVNESKEFFSRISKQFKDHNNILYEIMNEPCGTTTWQNCKDYANQVIPVIRENTDAIVLVGNPRWSADLNSVMASPLQGYTNIMYTYHFYAADHRSTTQVVRAYDSGFPVFISEYGLMNSDGNGTISETSGNNWMSVLNARNISYVAWNISNSSGDASIMKTNSTEYTNFSDSNLKVWGLWLKNHYQIKAGLK